MKRRTILIILACLLIGAGGGYGIGYIIYEPKLASHETELTSYETPMGNVLDITVTQHYEWTYEGKTWQWDFPIPLSTYVEYLEKPRLASASYYVGMVRDSKDDPYIDEIIRRINSAAVEEGFTERQKVNFVIAFIQSLPYTKDAETTPYDDYPRYPIETLFDRGGDCEDVTILAATLLDRMGYDVALLLIESAEHMAIGISMLPACGVYYEVSGKKYFYLETTREGHSMGLFPLDVTDKRAWVYPI